MKEAEVLVKSEDLPTLLSQSTLHMSWAIVTQRDCGENSTQI